MLAAPQTQPNVIKPVAPYLMADYGTWTGMIFPLLKVVMEAGDSGMDERSLHKALLDGDMQLWNINNYRALAVTEILTYPVHKTLTIFYLVGNGMDAWLTDFIGLMTDFGKEYDCKYMEFFGRRGWEKVAPLVGFEHKYTVMARRIDDGEIP